MGDVIRFPSKDERDARSKKTVSTETKKTDEKAETIGTRKIDIEDLINSFASLHLPAGISTEITQLIPEISKLPSLQKLAYKIYLQDLRGYGHAVTEPSLDFKNNNLKLASKIASLSYDSQRAIYHFLTSSSEDSLFKNALYSVRHTIRKIIGLA